MNCFFRTLQAKEKGSKKGQEERLVSWLEIRCYQTVLMERLIEMQAASVCPETFLSTGHTAAVLTRPPRLSSG